jgi:hypothetical protein
MMAKDEPGKLGKKPPAGSVANKPKDVQIIGGSPVDRTGPVKILDKNSPAEPTGAEVHVHADRKSYKEALKKEE